MSNVSQYTTEEQLSAIADDGHRYELVNGELRMMSPAGGHHGLLASRLLRKLGNFVEEHGLGETYAAETGFLLSQNPDTVRAPDLAFVAETRVKGFEQHQGFLPLAPDLAAEIVSPNDRFADVEEKAICWLEAGVKLVLVIDPQTKTVREYRSKESILVRHQSDIVEGDDVVPGWTLNVSELFA